ncbi:MAG: potassium transporter TrkG, partial [Flavobacteriales bacterium]
MFEGVMVLLLAVEGFSYIFYDTMFIPMLFNKMGIQNVSHFSTIFIQFYFFFVIIAEIAQSKSYLPWNLKKVHPSNIFIASFLVLIAGGTLLLLLPKMTEMEGSMPFLDALFTSTSASCVTGLIVVDTPAYFTFKGEIVLLLLMQLGGLNIVVFGIFIAIGSKMGLSFKQHEVIEDFVNKDAPMGLNSMLGKVFLGTFLIESIGALLLFFSWSPSIGAESTGDRVLQSVFHSVSAFMNAGFSLFTNSLAEEGVRNNHLVHIIMAALIFLGALGFMALLDIFNFRNIKQKIKYPWKQYEFITKLSLYVSVALLLFGMVMFYILEFDDQLTDKSFMSKLVHALFQSVTTRTAGFNTIDIGALSIPTLILLIFLM